MKLYSLVCVVAGLSPIVVGRASATSVYGIDANQNGVSDIFEMLYPSASNPAQDADSDGRTNGEEAAAGTNPLDGSSRLDFVSVEHVGGKLRVTWLGVAGKQYRLESSPGLEGAVWTPEGSARLGAGEVLVSETPAAQDRLFIRLNAVDLDSDGDGVTD
jgi:hypothetical protein